MSGDRLTSATQALLKVARTDGPNAAARAKVWSGVSAAVGGAAGAAAAGAGAGGSGVATSAVGVSAAKMLVSGTLLGGVVTVGLAALLLHFGPLRPSPARTARAGEPQARATSMAPPAPPVDDSFAGACTGASLNWAPGTLAAPPSLAARPAPATLHSSVRPSHGVTAGILRAPSAQPATADDSLTREASLVAEARAALAAGNAQEALRLVRSARSMRAPQLVPEELTVEAQALRALGKTDDAQGVDATLHSQYPDSALAR
jgi:hypothetical protein